MWPSMVTHSRNLCSAQTTADGKLNMCVLCMRENNYLSISAAFNSIFSSFKRRNRNVGTPKIYLGFNALSEIMHSIKMYFILFIFISKYDATTICLLIFNAKACSIQVYYCKPVTVELEGAS